MNIYPGLSGDRRTHADLLRRRGKRATVPRVKREENMEDDNGDRKSLTLEQAETMLPDKRGIHTFRQAGPVLIGTDWPRADVLELFRSYTPELSGENATRMGHGIAVQDNRGWLFVETRK